MTQLKETNQVKKTYVLREKGTGMILLESNYHGNGLVINIITDRKEIETKHKMYFSKNYYIDEIELEG